MGQDRAALEARIRQHLELGQRAESATEDALPDVGALRKRFERRKERPVRMAEKEGLLGSRPH